MKKLIIYSLCLFFISACTSSRKTLPKEEDRLTIEFQNIKQQIPFKSCKTSLNITTPILFKDSSNTFSIKIDSNWTYKKMNHGQGSIIHKFHPKNRPEISMMIAVEEELLTQKKANINFNAIWPHDNLKMISFGSDSAFWHIVNNTSELNNGEVHHNSQSNFYYYHKSSKRYFVIVLTEEKTTKEEINLQSDCFFKQSIQSFIALEK